MTRQVNFHTVVAAPGVNLLLSTFLVIAQHGLPSPRTATVEIPGCTVHLPSPFKVGASSLHFDRTLASTYCTGTSVAFFGNTPPPTNSQWVLVSIDGGQAYNTSSMDPSPPTTRQWYQSPTLPDAQHTISITHIPSISVDYAVVTAGQNTPLSSDTTLIVDDGDPSIRYTGDWTRNTNIFTSSDNPMVGLPHGNATHQSTSTGASATFGFTGMFTFSLAEFPDNRFTWD